MQINFRSRGEHIGAAAHGNNVFTRIRNGRMADNYYICKTYSVKIINDIYTYSCELGEHIVDFWKMLAFDSYLDDCLTIDEQGEFQAEGVKMQRNTSIYSRLLVEHIVDFLKMLRLILSFEVAK
jgi:hypothetical protein